MGGGRESVRRGRRKKAEGEEVRRGGGVRKRERWGGREGSRGGGRMGKEVEVEWNGCA